jgi:hypothetical protein
MKSYYVKKANNILPIYGVSSMEEAMEFIDHSDHGRIVETEECVYMNPFTGSIDFESGWIGTMEGLVEVVYSAHDESWVQKK